MTNYMHSGTVIEWANLCGSSVFYFVNHTLHSNHGIDEACMEIHLKYPVTSSFVFILAQSIKHTVSEQML